MLHFSSNRPARAQPFRTGIKCAVPIAIGYIPIGIAYGLLARSFSIPPGITLLMSLLVFAGASQFIAIQLIVAGIAYWQIVLTTFILNLRHLLMSASLARRMPSCLSGKWKAVLAFGITDETFSVASMQDEKTLPKEFLLGLNLVAFISWNAGTWIGIFLASGLPPAVQNSMGIALYAMFIGLLVPSLRESRPAIGVSLLAVIFHSALHWGVSLVVPLSAGWNIILATLFASALGVRLFGGDGDSLE